MKVLNHFFLLPLCVGLVLLAGCKQQAYKPDIATVSSAMGTAVYQPDWDNIATHYTFPDWFCDAKFGIFIHWGVYSVPAFGTEWYARNMYKEGSREFEYHRKTYGEQSEFGYKEFIPMFTAEKFDAGEWADVFLASGAKYVVPVAEHHDGFAMYASDLNPFNAAVMGPKKDIVGLLKTAVEARGMTFGLSTHRAENAWFYNGGMDFLSDVQDLSIALYGGRLPGETVNDSIMTIWLERTYELVDKYQPQLIWFDWTVNRPGLMPYFNRFMAYYYNNAIDWNNGGVVINTKFGYPENIQVWDVERGKSNEMKEYPWQTDTSIGKKSWSYVDDEENKTPEQIIHDLVDIVSKNGNLLLNIGPRSDGTITEEQKDVLFEIGRWLKINGEGIYGTRTWITFGEGNTEGTSGSFTDNTATPYTSQDIRFTKKDNCLYATCLAWIDGKILIHSLADGNVDNLQIKDVTMLGSTEKISWVKTKEGLEIQFPSTKPCDYAYVFKIQLI